MENAMTTLTYNQHRKPIGGLKDLLSRIGHGLSVYLANFSVAMAWANGRRANPADLELAGFSGELEDRVIASTKSQYAR
jgi:hypothetical protein